MNNFSNDIIAINNYRKFFDEIHSDEFWSKDFLYPELKGEKKHIIFPLLMSENQAKTYNVWWYSELVNIFLVGKYHGIVDDIIVHGSYGDFSYTRFSDLEITVLVNHSVFIDNNKKKELSMWIKNELNKFIVKVDPLQHHGAFFIWEGLMNSYSQLILPVCAYSNCWSLSGEPINFHSLDNLSILKSKSHDRLTSTLYKLMEPDKHFFRFGYNSFSIKRYLSNIMIIPAFYYQSKGKILSKKESIEKFSLNYSGEFSEVLDLAKLMRLNWPEPPKILRVMRPWFVSESIPQNRYDIILLSLFINFSIKRKIKNDIVTIAQRAAATLFEELNGNHQ